MSRRRGVGGHVYLFHHIPKSAGSTVEHHIEQTYPPPRSLKVNFKAETKAEVLERLAGDRLRPDRLVSIHGHRVFHGLHEIVPDRDPRYFTFLRSPVDRVASLYNFWADRADRRAVMHRDGALIPFAEFIETPAAQNNTLRFLAHAMEGAGAPGAALEGPADLHVPAAKRFLDACWFVGFVERFADDYAVVADAMRLQRLPAVRNDSRAHLDRSEIVSSEARLLELNAADVELYEHARARRGLVP